MITETWRRRALVLSFVRRQYQLRYRQSLAGFSWAIIPPLASLFVATVVFDKVIGVDTGDVPYPLFALAGLVPWSFFGSMLSTGVPSVAGQQMMITRLAFPRATIPIAAVGGAIIDLGLTFALLFAYTIITGYGIGITALWIPVLLTIELAFAIGIIFLGSALNVFARDIRLAVPLAVQFWLFLTPVMYPLETVPPNLRAWYLANPMTGLIESFRTVLIDKSGPDLELLVPSLIGAVAALVVGGWYFAAIEHRFADVV